MVDERGFNGSLRPFLGTCGVGGVDTIKEKKLEGDSGASLVGEQVHLLGRPLWEMQA